MPVTNMEIRRTAKQVFASTRGYDTPFYNRVDSKAEIEDRFREQTDLEGLVFMISAPLGTGKTFFLETVGSELGIPAKTKPLLMPELDQKQLKKVKGKILFIDESDIKTTWPKLREGMEMIHAHIEKTGQAVILLGDHCLKNPGLTDVLSRKEYLRKFEPLDKTFLQGVVRQRLEYYLEGKRQDDLIDDDLYDVLVPDELAAISSFRAVLSILERISKFLPVNNDPCKITLDLARQWIQEEYDPLIDTQRQEDFLNLLLDFIAENHRRCSGLTHGLGRQQLFSMGKRFGFADMSQFEEEIIEPFTRNEILVSKGVPGCDPNGIFIRRPEPFYPSIPLLLLAET